MSRVKASTCVSIAGLIATVSGSMVALAQVAPTTPPKVIVPTTPAQLPVTQYPLITGIIAPPVRVQPPLRGFVDLHTHPLSYLGFGGKLIYGGVDVGSWLPPENPPLLGSCFLPQPIMVVAPNNIQYRLGVAGSQQDALGHENEVHGGYGTDNACGDYIRDALILGLQQIPPTAQYPDSQEKVAGFQGQESANVQDFPSWPAWNDLTGQKMWVDWLRRAYQGGLRVMVALAVNNKLLGNLTSGPGDLPTDDKSSADLQIMQIKAFVGRHSDGTNDNFMKIAYSSSDLYNIVSSGRLAVVIGVEIDNIGNLTGDLPPCSNLAPAQCPLIAEVDRLQLEGVRYIFPVHLVDNPIGGAAAYNDLFDIASAYEEGNQGFALGCSGPNDNITYVYTLPTAIQKGIAQVQSQVAQTAPPAVPPAVVQSFVQAVENFLQVALADAEQKKLGQTIAIPPGVNCPLGNVNTRGLTAAGAQAIQEMMNQHMLIDIDHMSQAAALAALSLAQPQQQKNYGYPLNSGHNGLRGALPGGTSERNFSATQYAAIGQLHGMAGIGSAQLNAVQWLSLYEQTTSAMNNGGVAGFGTDFDGMEFGMPPRGTSYGPGQCPASYVQSLPSVIQQQLAALGCFVPSSNVQPGTPAFPLPPASDGNRIWNYNTEGVAHYGMLPDFLADVLSLPGTTVRDPVSGAVISLPSGADLVNNGLMKGAEYFYETWRLAEGNPLPQCPAPQQPDATGLCTCPASTTYNGHGGCACPIASQTYLGGYLGNGACGCAAGTVPDQNGNCVTPWGGSAGNPVTNVCPPACKYGCNAITKICSGPPKQIKVP